MLKGISPLISPELLKVLAEMGHGDEIVLGDANFPAASMGKNIVIRCDGHKIPELLEAILSLFPLDTFVEAPVAVMQYDPAKVDGEPPIWHTFREIVKKHAPEAQFDYVERFDFYDRAQKAYCVVQTGEGALYSNILLKKGVIPF